MIASRTATLKVMQLVSLILISLWLLPAAGETAQLKINGDLMIHPDQISNFFDIAANRIRQSAGWDWPEVTFTKPYKTVLSTVQAKGPFDVVFTTQNMGAQEASFELTWNQPTVTVGRFEIHDVLTRNIGGHVININLDGACSDMNIKVPGGQWKIKGQIKWSWSSAGMKVEWQDFQFTRNDSAQTAVDLGRCEGPAGLQAELKNAVLLVSKDQQWMQDVLRDGLLDWIESSVDKLQVELLKTRELELRPGLTMAWRPMELSDASQGRLRVAGQIVLSKEALAAREEILERSYELSALAQVSESGFVLPHTTLQKAVDFMYQNGDLGLRINSLEVPAFVDLMKSRFIQFFVWPDLMAFAKKTKFWFDFTTEQSPKLSDPQMTDKGLSYQISAPLIVHQWAPTATQYLNYVDFRSQMNGTMLAKISNGELTLLIEPKKLNVKSKFRSEYSKTRAVNARIADSLLGSRLSSYLSAKPFKLDVPSWEVGENLFLGLSDLKVTGDSFRIPLEFKNNK
jgi:hypothetical protein